MILIADSGSTKTSWCLIENDHKLFFQTEGYNPFLVKTDYIISSLEKSLPPAVNKGEVHQIYFYGSGCIGDKVTIIRDALATWFINASIQVESDLLAAARALLGEKPGFAAILGTGTNSCLYNGKAITHNISSLGYILGDEGSGVYMGKKLLTDYMRGRLPKDLNEIFRKVYNLTQSEILDYIYKQPLPNRFCAGFTKFLAENLHHEYASALVKSSFYDFFKNMVSSYPHFSTYTFNCVGSIAFYFKEILTEVALEFNMKTGTIIQSPIEGLIKYHLEIKQEVSTT